MADNVYFGESARRDGGDRSDSYGDRQSGYGGGNYGGNSYGSGRGGYQQPRQQSAPAPSSPFSELDDGDGELPF